LEGVELIVDLAEAHQTQSRHDEGDGTMDPGALGTLMIGLKAVDAELELDAPQSVPERTPRQSSRQLRVALAIALRTLADRLEPASREPQTAQS
jgi:hypothetical protein